MIVEHKLAFDKFVNLSDVTLSILLFVLAGIAIMAALFGSTVIKAAIAAWLALP